MSGETEKNISGWSVDTLREALLREIQSVRDVMHERDQRYAAEALAAKEAAAFAHEASKDALQLARAFDTKMEMKNNEFRSQLKDQELTYIPRPEADSRIANVRNEAWTRIDALDRRLADLSQRMDRSEGRGVGLNAGWGYLVGGIGVLGGLIGIVFAIFK